MVTDLFLGLLTGLISALASTLLPWTLPIPTATLNDLTGQYTKYNTVLPVTETGFMITLFFAPFFLLNALKWGKVVLNLIRGAGA